jgi:hypothetical protein
MGSVRIPVVLVALGGVFGVLLLAFAFLVGQATARTTLPQSARSMIAASGPYPTLTGLPTEAGIATETTTTTPVPSATAISSAIPTTTLVPTTTAIETSVPPTSTSAPPSATPLPPTPTVIPSSTPRPAPVAQFKSVDFRVNAGQAYTEHLHLNAYDVNFAVWQLSPYQQRLFWQDQVKNTYRFSYTATSR